MAILIFDGLEESKEEHSFNWKKKIVDVFLFCFNHQSREEQYRLIENCLKTDMGQRLLFLSGVLNDFLKNEITWETTREGIALRLNQLSNWIEGLEPKERGAFLENLSASELGRCDLSVNEADKDNAAIRRNRLSGWIDNLEEAKRSAFLERLSACSDGRCALANLGYRQDT